MLNTRVVELASQMATTIPGKKVHWSALQTDENGVCPLNTAENESSEIFKFGCRPTRDRGPCTVLSQLCRGADALLSARVAEERRPEARSGLRDVQPPRDSPGGSDRNWKLPLQIFTIKIFQIVARYKNL